MAIDSMTAGFAGSAVYVLVLGVALRVSGRSPAAIAVLLAVGLYPAGLVACALVSPPVRFWDYSAAYAFPTLCFIMVFGAVYKSISLRMLLELLGRPAHRDAYDALLARYVAGASFRDRLEVAVDSQLAVRDTDGYVLTAKGRRLAGAVALLQRAFGITRSG
jgi:hypothetical protein